MESIEKAQIFIDKKMIENVDRLTVNLLEAYKAIVNTDNEMLEESGYTYFCNTHDHDCCGDCIVNKAIQYISDNKLI